MNTEQNFNSSTSPAIEAMQVLAVRGGKLVKF